MREYSRWEEASNLVLLLKSGEFMSSGGPVAVGRASQWEMSTEALHVPSLVSEMSSTAKLYSLQKRTNFSG